MTISHLVTELRNHPALTGLFGSVTGWASLDLLRATQIFAGVTAGLVSLGTLIIIAPKIYAQLRKWWLYFYDPNDSNQDR